MCYVVNRRAANTHQGSPLRGVPSQGAFNSPAGSPSTSAVFSPGSLAAGDDSPASYSASASSPAQSSPERAYSGQLSQVREAAAAGEKSGGEAEEEAAAVKDSARGLQVTSATSSSSSVSHTSMGMALFALSFPVLHSPCCIACLIATTQVSKGGVCHRGRPIETIQTHYVQHIVCTKHMHVDVQYKYMSDV